MNGMLPVTDADRYIFHLINSQWQNSFFDGLMPLLRNANLWLPLYLFILLFALLNLKKAGWFILLAACTPALTDLVSSHIIKEHIFRLRPCNDPSLVGQIRVLASYCPQSSSFTSSHAANHFGLATFISLTMRPVIGKWIYVIYLWALMIVYAQMYVGVHYPTDILGGAVVGVLAGLLTAWVFKNKVGTFIKDNQLS